MIFGISMLLISITLGVGYSVLVKAVKQDGGLKKLGKIIAWFIIVISILGMLCATVNTLILKRGRCRMCISRYHHMKSKGKSRHYKRPYDRKQAPESSESKKDSK